MTVREAVLAAIQLAEARAAEAQAIDIEIGEGLGYELHPERLTRLMSAPRPAEAALISHLEALPDDALFRVRTLMYVGRGDSSDVLGLHADLAHDAPGRDEAISSMVEKSPLASYLQRGLTAASDDSIDLEGVWPTNVRDLSNTSYETPSAPKPLPRQFPTGQHPIENGGDVFRSIADEWVGDLITDAADVARFFDLLMRRTGGLVILDFIDLASWDQIDGHAFDPDTRDLELYWHDFRAADDVGGRSELDTMFFPASLYGLLIRLKEIRIIRGRSAAFLTNGFVCRITSELPDTN